MDEKAAFQLGYDAFENGWAMDWCPPFADPLLREAWRDGWRCAMRDLIETEKEAMEARHDEQDLKTLFNER